MATWDKTLPPGSTKISLGDNSIRDNNEALEDALDLEHNYASGSDDVQTGRHAFVRDTNSNLGAISPVLVDGSIAFSSNERASQLTAIVMDAGALENVDVNPLNAAGDPTIPRIDERSKFEVSQFAKWEVVAPVANEWTPDFSKSPFQSTTIVGDTAFKSPTGGFGSGAWGSIITLDMSIDGSGPYSFTWAAEYRAVGSFVPLNKNSNQRTLIQMILSREGSVIVSSIPDFNGSTVTS